MFFDGITFFIAHGIRSGFWSYTGKPILCFLFLGYLALDKLINPYGF
jgi:hypothetical protein